MHSLVGEVQKVRFSGFSRAHQIGRVAFAVGQSQKASSGLGEDYNFWNYALKIFEF
jgi:hypothetical protein